MSKSTFKILGNCWDGTDHVQLIAKHKGIDKVKNPAKDKVNEGYGKLTRLLKGKRPRLLKRNGFIMQVELNYSKEADIYIRNRSSKVYKGLTTHKESSHKGGIVLNLPKS